jgi:hypothetical protein
MPVTLTHAWNATGFFEPHHLDAVLAQLLERAEDLHVVLLGQGWIELRAPRFRNHARTPRVSRAAVRQRGGRKHVSCVLSSGAR